MASMILCASVISVLGNDATGRLIVAEVAVVAVVASAAVVGVESVEATATVAGCVLGVLAEAAPADVSVVLTGALSLVAVAVPAGGRLVDVLSTVSFRCLVLGRSRFGAALVGGSVLTSGSALPPPGVVSVGVVADGSGEDAS
jgi:hypothetical protein